MSQTCWGTSGRGQPIQGFVNLSGLGSEPFLGFESCFSHVPCFPVRIGDPQGQQDILQKHWQKSFGRFCCFSIADNPFRWSQICFLEAHSLGSGILTSSFPTGCNRWLLPGISVIEASFGSFIDVELPDKIIVISQHGHSGLNNIIVDRPKKSTVLQGQTWHITAVWLFFFFFSCQWNGLSLSVVDLLFAFLLVRLLGCLCVCFDIMTPGQRNDRRKQGAAKRTWFMLEGWWRLMKQTLQLVFAASELSLIGFFECLS